MCLLVGLGSDVLRLGRRDADGERSFRLSPCRELTFIHCDLDEEVRCRDVSVVFCTVRFRRRELGDVVGFGEDPLLVQDRRE